jgi:hypothetical protein
MYPIECPTLEHFIVPAGLPMGREELFLKQTGKLHALCCSCPHCTSLMTSQDLKNKWNYGKALFQQMEQHEQKTWVLKMVWQAV